MIYSFQSALYLRFFELRHAYSLNMLFVNVLLNFVLMHLVFKFINAFSCSSVFSFICSLFASDKILNIFSENMSWVVELPLKKFADFAVGFIWFIVLKPFFSDLVIRCSTSKNLVIPFLYCWHSFKLQFQLMFIKLLM